MKFFLIPFLYSCSMFQTNYNMGLHDGYRIGCLYTVYNILNHEDIPRQLWRDIMAIEGNEKFCQKLYYKGVESGKNKGR
jgi:hypothetical protein